MKNKIIIFEGIDNVGKSTQIKLIEQHLAKTTNMPSLKLHFSGVKDIIDKDYYKRQYIDFFEIINSIEYSHCHLIADRSHIGEFVYGEKYRKYDGSYVFDIENNIENFDNLYLIILVDTSLKCIDREDGFSYTIDPTEKNVEIKRFKKAYDYTNIKKKIVIDIKNKSIEEVFIEIKKNIGE